MSETKDSSPEAKKPRRARSVDSKKESNVEESAAILTTAIEPIKTQPPKVEKIENNDVTSPSAPIIPSVTQIEKISDGASASIPVSPAVVTTSPVPTVVSSTTESGDGHREKGGGFQKKFDKNRYSNNNYRKDNFRKDYGRQEGGRQDNRPERSERQQYSRPSSSGSSYGQEDYSGAGNESGAHSNSTSDIDLTDINLTDAEKSELNSKDLKSKNIADLTSLALKLKIENAAGMRRQDMVFEVLKRAARLGEDIYGSGAVSWCDTPEKSKS